MPSSPAPGPAACCRNGRRAAVRAGRRADRGDDVADPRAGDAAGLVRARCRRSRRGPAARGPAPANRATSRSRTASLAALSTGCGRCVAEDAVSRRHGAVDVELGRRPGPGARAGSGTSQRLGRERRRAATPARRARSTPSASHRCPPACARELQAISLSRAPLAIGAAGVAFWRDSDMGYRVAVVGATGNVGREILNILAERQFPLDEIAAVASPRSTGDVDRFRRQPARRSRSRTSSISTSPAGTWRLFAAGSAVSKVHVPARRRGRLHGDRQSARSSGWTRTCR